MAKGQRAQHRRAKKRKERERRLAQERHRRQSAPASFEDLPEEDEPMPSRFLMERALRGMRHGPDGPELESPDARNARIEALLERAARDAESLDAHERAEAAQELAYRATEVGSADDRLALVAAAVALDRDCVDALTLAAELAESADERVQALARAVAAGERALGGPAFFEEHAGHFWGLVETRPYMRARHALAVELHGLGRREEAALHYRALLDLNPRDNQGVRDALAALELERGDLAGARALFERYPEDGFAVHAWARILERFLAGERRAAARAARLAERDNPHVREALAGRTRPRRGYAGHYRPRTESEAAYVVEALGAAWAAHPQALAWLREGAPTSTAEERRAAVHSYAAPLSELLTRGQPEFRGESDAQAFAGLGRDHVGELVRMATDAALSEQGPDAAAVWAPIHAIRALAHLRAAEAVEPLLGLLLEGFDDDWLIQELVLALSRIASPGMPVLARVLADGGAPGLARTVAAEVLGEIPRREPAARSEAVAGLAHALRLYRDNPADLNAMIVMALVDARAGEHAGLMREAFEAGRVDTLLCGSWEEIEAALELP